MKNLILLPTLILFLGITHAQTPIQEWAARYDHSGNTDVFLDMIQDNAGNTYVCGYSDDPATGTDIVVAKFELDGDTAWIYRYNNPQANGEDKTVTIALTNDNDVVVAGHSETVSNGWDAITIMISGVSGTIMSGWPKFYDGSEHGKDFANDVAVRQSDNMIVICGALEDDDNSENLLLLSYAPSGTINWTGSQTSNNNNNTDHSNLFCAFFNNGNVAAISRVTNGSFGSTVVAEFDILNGSNGAVAEIGYFSTNGPNAFTYFLPRDIHVHNNTIYTLIDWNSYGNVYGAAVYKLGSNDDQGVYPTATLNYDEPDSYSTGVSANSNGIYICGAEDVNSFSAVELDGFVSRFDQSGNSQYYQTYDNGNDDIFTDIAIDNFSNANAYVTGFTTVGGNRNIVKAKFTSTGVLDWDMHYNGTSNGTDEAYRIAVGSGNTNGSIWVCGKSVGTGDDGIVIKCCVPPVADAGLDKEYCTGDDVQIGSATTSGYSYDWTPAAGLNNANISNPTVSLTNSTDCPETHEYVLKVTNTNGCSNYDTVMVEVFHRPEVSIVSSQPNIICENESPIIITPTISVGCEGTPIYSWKQDGNLAQTPNNLSNPYSVSQVSQSGNYTLTVTNNYGATSCATTSNSVSATVNPIPVGTATPTVSEICVDEATSIQLSSSLNGTTYVWSGSGAGSSGGSLNSISQTLNASGTATYTITPTVTTTGCVGNDFTATVTVNPLPAAPTITASGVTEFCNGGSVTLTSSAASSYAWSPNGGSSISTNVNATGSYAVTITDANGCQNTSAPLQATVNDNPVVDAGSDKTFCAGYADFLGGNPTASGAQSPYTYTWTNSSNLDDATSANPNILTTLTSGNYNFSVSVEDGNGCTGADQVLVTVLNELVADAGSDAAVCVGDSVLLVGSGGDNFAWSPTTGLSASTISEPMASPAVTTEYRLIVWASGCVNDTTEVTVNVNPLPIQPTVTVNGLDITCNESASSYQWNINGNSLTGEIGQTIYGADQCENYSVTITDENGCSNTSTDVSCPVGISDIEVSHIKLYPNPNTGQFFIQNGETPFHDAQLTIMDMLGKVVHTENITNLAEGGRKAFNLQLRPGVYVISISDADSKLMQRFIVE